ncbi:RusA family crossover junction endodeoxyribonuclease [Virgibacillus sp. L01]|uniref:RusA family crossover junction endodeoxyribonuclease n=1 Tax=Virgibacillus sp. L01 TaxID=3457429 RepID=UPI003FCF2627
MDSTVVHAKKTTNEPVGVNITLYICGSKHGDIDNLFKGVTDSLNKIVYNDDRQIKAMKSRILACEKDKERSEVEVYLLDALGNIANH